jgi:hypothetical protein
LLGASDRAKEPAAPRQPGVGLRILIEGSLRETETTRVVEEAPAPVTAITTPEVLESKKEMGGELRSWLSCVALIGADFALLGWVAHYVLTHRHVLGAWGIAGCVVTTLLAALCGCAATFVVARQK